MKISIFLLFLPGLLFAQFEQVANDVCDKGTKAFIVFGDDDLNQTILKQPELSKLWVYEMAYDSEFGRRLKVNSPTMYLFDKNMRALAQEDVSRSGWRRMKEALKKPTSKDCLLIAEKSKEAPEELVSRPSEEELGQFKIEVPDVEPWQPEPIPAQPEPTPTPKPTPSPDKQKTTAKTYANEDQPAALTAQKFWTVQIGAYTSEANAKKKASQYPDLYPTYKLSDGLYKVTFGAFTQQASAKEFASKYNGIVKEITW